MSDLKTHIKNLLKHPGLSGYEESVRSVIEEAWKPYVDELSLSRLGSLHGFIGGSGNAPRRQVLMAAHMDAIGLMVTQVQEGFLRFSDFGSVDYRMLPGQLVTVHAKKDVPGIVIQPPPHLLPQPVRNKPAKPANLLIDVGLPGKVIADLIQPGNPVSFSQQPMELFGDVISGHSIDNRVSVAAITYCLQELRKMVHSWDIWAVATVLEEENFGGALTSPYKLQPNIAIAIDVTHAQGVNVPEHQTAVMGKGPTLGFGANIHPELHKYFKDLAEELEIPHQIEVMSGHSGTDAYGMQIVAEGIPTFVLSIPVRYMHTPVETVNVKDVKRAGRLLAAFINSLEPSYLDSTGWMTP